MLNILEVKHVPVLKLWPPPMYVSDRRNALLDSRYSPDSGYCRCCRRSHRQAHLYVLDADNGSNQIEELSVPECHMHGLTPFRQGVEVFGVSLRSYSQGRS
jgi:hypothetical protein